MNVRPSCSSTVSIVSRVVPGHFVTIVRSAPISALKSDDLPTFGRPRIATRIASSSGHVTAPTSPGSRSSTSSSRSPVFEPCSPEIGNGSPKPSRWNSSASDSCDGSSILFASSEHRLLRLAEDLRELLVARASRRRGRRRRTARGRPRRSPSRACSRDLARDRVRVDDVDAAGVDQQEALARSTRRSAPCGRASSPASRARPPGASTVSRLISVDLPTFGKPTIATVPICRSSSAASPSSRRRSCVGPRARRSARRRRYLAVGRPCACRPASQSKSTLMRRSISTRRLPVALAALRQPLEAQRLAECDRARREVAELPELRAVDRDRDDGHVLLHRHHRRARLRGPGRPESCACLRRRGRRA